MTTNTWTPTRNSPEEPNETPEEGPAAAPGGPSPAESGSGPCQVRPCSPRRGNHTRENQPESARCAEQPVPRRRPNSGHASSPGDRPHTAKEAKPTAAAAPGQLTTKNRSNSVRAGLRRTGRFRKPATSPSAAHRPRTQLEQREDYLVQYGGPQKLSDRITGFRPSRWRHHTTVRTDRRTPATAPPGSGSLLEYAHDDQTWSVPTKGEARVQPKAQRRGARAGVGWRGTAAWPRFPT